LEVSHGNTSDDQKRPAPVAQPSLFRYKSEVPTANYLALTACFLITLKAVNGTVMNSIHQYTVFPTKYRSVLLEWRHGRVLTQADGAGLGVGMVFPVHLKWRHRLATSLYGTLHS